jgi:hypothetical protein
MSNNLNALLNKYLAAKKELNNYRNRNPGAIGSAHNTLLNQRVLGVTRNLLHPLSVRSYGLMPAHLGHLYPYGFGYNIPAFHNALAKALRNKAARNKNKKNKNKK